MTVTPIATPGTVVVDAGCPSCGERDLMLLSVAAELLVTDDGAEIRLKGKSRGRPHICGQLPLPVGTSDAAGQTSFADRVMDRVVEQVNAGALDREGVTVSAERVPSDDPAHRDGRVPCPQDGCSYSAENQGSIPAHLAMAHPEVPMDEIAPRRVLDDGRQVDVETGEILEDGQG